MASAIAAYTSRRSRSPNLSGTRRISSTRSFQSVAFATRWTTFEMAGLGTARSLPPRRDPLREYGGIGRIELGDDPPAIEHFGGNCGCAGPGERVEDDLAGLGEQLDEERRQLDREPGWMGGGVRSELG